MRGAVFAGLLCFAGFACLGCIRDEDFYALQADVTQLESRLQTLETGALKETQTELSTLAQSQRAQTGTLDQSLSRLSYIERELDTIGRQQQSILARLDSLEKAQLRDRQDIQKTLEAISTEQDAKIKASLNELRKEFNEAQVQLGKNIEQKMAGFTSNIETRIRKMDNEITNFYRDLEKTIQGQESYSGATYVVKPGDNLSKIAQELGVSLEDLARVNNIQDPSKIRVGQELKIP